MIRLRDDVKAIELEIDSLLEELKKRDKAYEGLQALRKLRDEGVSLFRFHF